MRKFLLRIFLFSSPFLLLFVSYIYIDPFMVIYDYDTFYPKEKSIGGVLDKDYVSTVTYEKQHEKYQYDSFIFGNSRSISYEINDWTTYLPKNSSCYHFDASGESLYGIHKKIKYIDENGSKINNALLVIDHTVLEKIKPGTSNLNYVSPQLEHYKNIFGFHLAFLKAYFSPLFCFAVIDYEIFGELRNYMREKNLLTANKHEYEQRFNEIRRTDAEQKIAEGVFYTDYVMRKFKNKQKKGEEYNSVILEDQLSMLQDMKRIFNKHHTNYRIVISPLWYQIKLNSKDLEILKQIFGNQNVFDFSGVNKFTCDYRNYYEDSHYRPNVAREIMSIIY